MDSASAWKADGRGIDFGREQNVLCFSFPYFFKYILQKHTFSFFHPEYRLFQNRNGILEANYRRKASDVTEHDWLPFHLGGGYGYT